jgi:microcephalin
VEVVAAVVDKLGGFIIEARVSERTTHVVTKGPRRTVNLLKGIARGCWIVQQEWVLRSLDADMWLDEDEYELADFSSAVQVIIFL